jgi:hypothetical protein
MGPKNRGRWVGAVKWLDGLLSAYDFSDVGSNYKGMDFAMPS